MRVHPDVVPAVGLWLTGSHVDYFVMSQGRAKNRGMVVSAVHDKTSGVNASSWRVENKSPFLAVPDIDNKTLTSIT